MAYVAFPFAHVLLWSAHFDRARVLLESLHADWSERDERKAAYALWYLAMVESGGPGTTRWPTSTRGSRGS